MTICIIDPASHIPSLKKLFPKAEYFAHEPDSFFTFTSTPHFTRDQVYAEYGLYYRTDWQNITSDMFDTLFIVAPLMDYYNTISHSMKPYTDRMLERIVEIISKNTFKTIAVFDMYDYDYDPSIIDTQIKAHYYFKRNYDKTKKYNSNVFPFPCMMFVKPCVLGMMLNKDVEWKEPRMNAPMWAGSLYKHIDTKFTPALIRDRKGIFDEIQQQLVVYNGLSHDQYIDKIKQHSIVVDLLGVGDPNKRIFEGFSTGTLVMTMSCDLNWGFTDGDDFHPDTKFRTAGEYFTKLNRLLSDREHYIKCLTLQNNLVNKYFTQDSLSRYILTSIKSI